MQDLIRRPMTTLNEGLRMARASLKLPAGEGHQDGGCPRSLATASVFCLFLLSNGLVPDFRTTIPLDYAIIKLCCFLSQSMAVICN